MKRELTLLLLAGALAYGTAQAGEENDGKALHFIETRARVDTMVTPDRIYMTIVLAEKDSKGKVSAEELAGRMAKRLTLLGIDMEKQLKVDDLSSTFRRSLLGQQVLKSTRFSLLVYDAATAMRVIAALEEEGIANASIERMTHAREEELRLELKRQAVAKAKRNAEAMAAPLGQAVGPAIYLSDVPQGNVATRSSMMMMRKEGLDVEFREIMISEEVVARFRL
ncbi:MAG: SIMPL domain-containing protein [Odoribacteraceae bacterium]|jgi:uncharacterized protein YggE|nr:SIMPL domain-containing protein [Odoribacteraceae bacterium]